LTKHPGTVNVAKPPTKATKTLFPNQKSKMKELINNI